MNGISVVPELKMAAYGDGLQSDASIVPAAELPPRDKVCKGNNISTLQRRNIASAGNRGLADVASVDGDAAVELRKRKSGVQAHEREQKVHLPAEGEKRGRKKLKRFLGHES